MVKPIITVTRFDVPKISIGDSMSLRDVPGKKQYTGCVVARSADEVQCDGTLWDTSSGTRVRVSAVSYAVKPDDNFVVTPQAIDNP